MMNILVHTYPVCTYLSDRVCMHIKNNLLGVGRITPRPPPPIQTPEYIYILIPGACEFVTLTWQGGIKISKQLSLK